MDDKYEKKLVECLLFSDPKLTVERVMECVSGYGGTGAYWKYEYEIPGYCHSK